MRKLLTILGVMLCVALMSATAFGQATYTWNVASGSWATSTSWTPDRTAPANDDILVFDGSVQATPTVTDVPAQTIGRMVLQNNAAVTVSSAAAVTLTIAGGTGTDFDVPAGSSLTLSASATTNTINITINTGATGSIGGSFTATGSAGATAHRLNPTDASSVNVTGSIFQGTMGATSFSGSMFGTTGTNNVVVMASGSIFTQYSGSNPFGSSQPNSRIQFQSGSTFYFAIGTSSTPSLTGRVYANFTASNNTTVSVTSNLTAGCTMANVHAESGSSYSFTTAGSGQSLSISGNISSAGTGNIQLGAATVVLNGGSAQTIGGGGGSGTITIVGGMTVNNSNGVTLQRPVTVNGTLTLTSGNLTTTNTNLLTVGSSGGVSGGSSSSFLNGPLAHTIASTSSTPKTFPLGKGSAYRPITITITQDAVTATLYTAEMFNSAPTSRTLPGSLDLVSPVRYWNVVKGAGANVTNASILISYDTDDGVSDATNLRVAKDDGAGNWVDLGGTGSAPTTGNITSTTNFTAFSDFVLANNTGGSNPLPVQIVSFLASANRSSAELRWSTATETNNHGFEIQRRGVGASEMGGWEKIGFVSGAGTSNSPREYTYTDNGLAPGRYAYRLRQIDNSGAFSYYGVAEVEVGLTAKEFRLESNYPNPFNPSTSIQFSLAENGRAILKVYNMLGQEVATLFDEVAEAGRLYEARFDARGLPSGLYFAQLESGKQQMVRKMLLTR